METLRINRLLLAAVAILVGLACWMGWGLGQNTDAEAHSIGWKWRYPEITPTVANSGTNYGAAIARAVTDFNRNTDLTVEHCTLPCLARILHTEHAYGHRRWIAAADSYHYGVLCSPGSRCNETNQRVTEAFIRWNSSAGPFGSSTANSIARHEMGHAFGLSHPPSCSTWSVMQTACPNPPSTLTRHDIADINNLY